jgi:hypothetical protein
LVLLVDDIGAVAVEAVETVDPLVQKKAINAALKTDSMLLSVVTNIHLTIPKNIILTARLINNQVDWQA